MCGGVEPRKGAYRRDAVNQIALERDAAVVVTSEPPGLGIASNGRHRSAC